MRLVLLMLSLTTLSSCAASHPAPTELPQPKIRPPMIGFSAQRYPNQTNQCAGEVSGERGSIQWASATTTDSIANTTRYYNRQTGIAKRRTKKDEHLWVVVNKTKKPRRVLTVMSIAKAQHLKLLCSNPIPENAQSAIIVSTFMPKPPPEPDYKHAAP
ncbi:hypothetical protein [Thiofilum flexile]|uniref:hypothetical protein n=1 Tax=Thiofilum flexile TaxID=125627 RepID=UPI00035EE4F4|nr:hypothetical protein [Thiofilum flexile]